MRKTSTSKAKGRKNRPKIKLGIPDLEHSKAAVLRSLASPDSRRGYQHAIDEFVAWYCSEPRLAFNKNSSFAVVPRRNTDLPLNQVYKLSVQIGLFQYKTGFMLR